MLKIKTLLFISVLLAFATAISAAPLIDSVGVKNNDGKKMVLFKVKAKDTYYSIAHRYHLKPEALMKFNGAKKPALSIGAVVEVPTEIPFKKSKESSETASKKSKKDKEPVETTAKETKKEKKERLAKEQQEAEEKERKEARAAKRRERKENAEKPEQTEQPETKVAEQPERTSPPVKEPAPQPAPVNDAPPMQYKVSAHETLYAISKRFNMTVEDLQKLNNLSSNNIQPGQVLMVRSGAAAEAAPPAAAPVAVQPVTRPSAAVVQQVPPPVAKRDSTAVVPKRDSSSTEKHNGSTRFGLYEKNEKGVATWIDDTSLDSNKKLVLHRTAPIGTVIKITNPMTNRTTFAKVVGRFTDTEATKDVIIVMTKNVADSLGALDKRFHVSISYGSPVE